MISIVYNESGVVYCGYEDMSVQCINITHALENFNPDMFIKEIRQKQESEMLDNIKRYERIKKSLIGRGFEVIDKDFNPECVKDYNYGYRMGSVVSVKKGNITVDFWANGHQEYKVFDDEYFFCCLWDLMTLHSIPKDRFKYIKKAFYYIVKMKSEGQFSGVYITSDINIFDLMKLSKYEKELIKQILNEGNCFKEYLNESMSDRFLPISWIVGFYDIDQGNWISIFVEHNGKKLNEGRQVDSENFLDELENMDEWYKYAVELAVNKK